MTARQTPPTTAAQLRIPFTRAARLRLLAAVDPAAAGVTRRTWINVAELLTQIELRTGAEGCYCYCETLWSVMFAGGGVTRSTFFRTRRVAGRLGLLAGQERTSRQGRASNEWRIAWDKIAALAARSGTVLAAAEASGTPEPIGQRGEASGTPAELFSRAGSETDRSQNGTDPCPSDTGRSQNGTDPLRGSSSTLVRSAALPLGSTRVDTAEKSDDQNCQSRTAGGGAGGAGRARSAAPAAAARPPASSLQPPVWGPEARALAERIVAQVGRPGDERDWQLAAKCAVLARGALGEAWLYGAIEGLRRRSAGPPQNRWAYFTRVAQDEARRRGKHLARELARVTLPPELAAWRAAPRPEPRLCGGDGEWDGGWRPEAGGGEALGARWETGG